MQRWNLGLNCRLPGSGSEPPAQRRSAAMGGGPAHFLLCPPFRTPLLLPSSFPWSLPFFCSLVSSSCKEILSKVLAERLLRPHVTKNTHFTSLEESLCLHGYRVCRTTKQTQKRGNDWFHELTDHNSESVQASLRNYRTCRETMWPSHGGNEQRLSLQKPRSWAYQSLD